MHSDPKLKAAVDHADAIVHLGAGQCRELADYQFLTSEVPIVLAEADPKLANALELRASDCVNIAVQNCAVSGQAGEATLHIYNLPEVSSLRPATGLKELFPGLRVVREVSVEAVTPAEVLQEEELVIAESICLVIDTPGEEWAILQSLQRDSILSRIGSIVLHCGKGALYENAVPADKILDFLEDQGYQLEGELDESDPDRPVWILKRNVEKLQIQRLDTELNEIRQELQQAREEAAKEREQLTSERDSLKKKLDERERQFEKTSEEQRAALNKEQEARARLEKQLDQVREEAAKERDQLTSERDSLKKKLDKLKCENERLASELADLKTENERLAAQVAEQDEELRDARSDMSVAIRLQTQRDGDLKDLQQRYEALLTRKEKQDELLGKLNHRLSIAAQSLRQLGADSASQTSDRDAAQELLRALSGELE